MTEYTLQMIAVAKIGWLLGFAYLYGLGGIKYKFLRRWIGAFWLVFGIMVFSKIMNYFSWWALAYYPLLVGALSLGYGADEPVEKIKKRTVYGLALGIAPLPLAIIHQAWVLLGLHIVLCVVVSVTLGVVNPMRNAREEETSIALTAGFLPLYM